MATANGAANLRKGPGGRPRVKNPVVPAIPLPYIQRRAQNQAANAAAAQPAPAQTNGDTQATPKGTPAEPAKAEPVQPHSNGIAKGEGEGQVATAPQAAPAPGIVKPPPREQLPKTPPRLTSYCAAIPAVVPPPSQTPSAPSTNSTAGDISVGTTVSTASGPGSPKSASAPSDEMNARASAAKMYPPPPPNLPAHMPPPFFPSANPQDVMYGMDGPRPSHQPHPSNGSLHFGNFHHESNTSSPAPHSGGYAPPPGLPMPNGRHSHMGRPSGPDFRPQSMGYGNDFEPTSVDPYGPSTAAYAPPDGGYPPYMGNYLPSTPHSFHGSQSSAPPDDMYGQFSPFGAANGSHNQVDDGRARIHASGPMMNMPPPLGMMPPMPPPHMLARMLEPDPEQFISHFKNSFQDPRFADCTLELRFPDNRAPPMKMPAHRLVLSRSAFLEKLMDSDQTPRRKGSSPNTVVITANDKYLRPDTFVTALQRLYGFPLFTIPAPPPGSEDLPLAGGAVDRLSFVVSYAAAGHLLQCLSVTIRGMEMATQLLSWDTLEPSLEFALGQSEARGTIDIHERYPYGTPTRILLDGIVGFVVDHIFPDFVLDTSVADPKGYRRLPEVPESPKRSPNAKRHTPAIAKGTSAHPTHGGRRSRLSKIKFGDMASEGPLSAEGQNGTNTTNQKQGVSTSPHIAALSRVLLNLPFSCLKAVLESPRLGHPEAHGEARQRVAVDVVSERESRRLAAVEAVKTGRVPKPEGARRVLASVEPRSADGWGVLGFQEAVAPVGNTLSPHISRAWVPLAPDGEAAGGFSGAAYP